MNIPGLVKIEEMDASDANFPFNTSLGVSSSNFSGSWSEIVFVPLSGGFESSPGNKGGYETKLQFFIAASESTAGLVVKEITENPKVYRVTDPQGDIFIIGSNYFKARAKATFKNDVPITNGRGYLIEVTVKSTHLPLVYS